MSETNLDKAPEHGIWRGDEIYTHVTGKETPIIEGLINEGDYVCIQAVEGIGKSVLMQQMKHNLTTGVEFLDMLKIPKPRNVLWNMAESKKNKHVRRLLDMKKAIVIDDTRWWMHNCVNYCLDDRDDYEKFRDVLVSTGVHFEVMFFDCLYGFLGENTNDNKPAKAFCNNMKELSAIYGSNCTLIFIHHVNKEMYNLKTGDKIETSGRVAGAKEWGAFFTTVFTLEKRKNGLHYLNNNKDRDGDAIGEIPMQMIVPQTDPSGRLFFTTDTDELLQKRKNGELKILNLLREKNDRRPQELYYPKGYRCESRVSHSQYYKIISKLVKDETVRIEEDEVGNRIVRLVR